MSAPVPLAGVRVVEFSAGVPAAYCGKLFADAGADVVMVEPGAGSALRARGPLFGFLAAGKRSLPAGPGTAELLADVDLVLTDGSHGDAPLRAHPATTVVSLTPFGTTGPYADLPVNEFVLQAMCGSIGTRGWPGEEPLQAGGRIGEWVAGVYGAVAGAAALRRARRTGAGDLVDVAQFEAMVVTMGGLGAVQAQLLGPDLAPAPRMLELPSIVPTADGLVGFCTVTAQQFADFLVLVGRPELIGDPELASFASRVARRHEFLAMVEEWAAVRTTAEIVEFASALRIPVAPIGTPSTVAGIDHFAERGVFVPNAAGLRQPRVPYRSDAFATVPPGEVPAAGASTVEWPARTRPVATDAPADRPLAGLRVVDLTAFWAGPAGTHTLAALGADVVKVEGLQRPDGMRFSGARPATEDLWWETGHLFQASNSGKRGVTLELGRPEARELALRLVAGADLVMENFSPRVLGNLGLEYDDLRAANPRVVVVRMPAFGLDGPWRDRVGFAQTMEQASGMAWMTGRADGLPLIPRGVCDPLAGLHAAFAAIVALEVRDATGAGMQVESTMVETALTVAAEAFLEAQLGAEPRRDGNRGPGAAPQGVYHCAGDDEWLAVAVTDDAAWTRLTGVLGRPDLAGRADLATEAGRRAAADELDGTLRGWTAGLDVHAAEATLRSAGIASARVAAPADLVADPQLASRGFWEEVEHPVLGSFRTTAMPFRLAGVPGPWIPAAAPTLGQHNDDVLGGELGLDAAELARLTEAGVLGTRPAGL
ncbi:CoA transferase [Blastococcus sp. URHD0036]|uniref:CaiB/BaiF CoA-transferase family protein n=1 Tax=Blastococcus sp. URHD0036 TaxID=1380356 RepID=UPI000496C842|nr:CoA transferase [Blastococcus sp. URHD0036]